MQQFERILVVKWGALGDLIAGTTALRGLREACPGARITLVSNELMFDVSPPGTLVDEIIPYEPERPSPAYHLRLVRELFKRKFDLSVNLRWTSERSALICWLSGARLRAGSGPKEARWLYNVRAPLVAGRRHEFLRNLDVVTAAGVPLREPRPFVHIPAEDAAFAEGYLRQHGCTPESTLILHPGASTPSKAWMPERFGQLGRLFVSHFGGNVLLTWGPGEEHLARRVAGFVDRNAIVSPPTSVARLAAVLAHGGLCVCNYSGAMNVAMAVQTPLIALGCTSPEDWGPYGALHRTVNSGRGNDSYSERERFDLMRRITVEQVWAVLQQRWSELHQRFHGASVG